jgi:hypothetical protein
VLTAFGAKPIYAIAAPGASGASRYVLGYHRAGFEMKSLRVLIFEQLQRRSGGQTAAEIASALGLPDGRSVAGQLKALEREGRVEVARFSAKNMTPGGSWRRATVGGQWFLPSSQRAYRLVRRR